MKYLNNEKYTFFNKNERNKFIKDNVLFDLNDDSILKIEDGKYSNEIYITFNSNVFVNFDIEIYEDGNYEIIFNKIIKA